MKKKRLILLLLSCAAFVPVSAAYQGRVYVDANRNGVYDKGEKVLKDVRVSDGLNVVRTNAEGLYTLPGHERERFIFITTPSGYKTDNRYYRRISGEEQATTSGCNPGKDASGRTEATSSSTSPTPRYSTPTIRKAGRTTSAITPPTRKSPLSSIPAISATRTD